jgi:hypothetical protein
MLSAFHPVESKSFEPMFPGINQSLFDIFFFRGKRHINSFRNSCMTVTLKRLLDIYVSLPINIKR